MNCDICNKWIKYPKNWDRHINSKSHIKKSIARTQTTDYPGKSPELPQITPNYPELPQNERFKCEYCPKTFARKYGLKRHQSGRCEKKNQKDAYEKEIADLKEQLRQSGNTTNNNTTNNITNNNITNNNVIIMQNFGNELVEFSDEFLHQLTHPDLSHQERRIMLENYISSEQQAMTLAKTNLRDKFMYAHEGQWKVIPQQLALTQRVNDIPSTYQRSAVHTITNWPEEEASQASKQAAIRQHSGIAMEMKYHKYTDDEDKELKTIVKCNAYNNKAVLSTDN